MRAFRSVQHYLHSRNLLETRSLDTLDDLCRDRRMSGFEARTFESREGGDSESD